MNGQWILLVGLLGVVGDECRTGEFEVVLNFGMAKLRTQLRGYTGYDQRPSIFDFG